MIQHAKVAAIAAVIHLLIMYAFKMGAKTSIKQIDEYSIEQSKNPIKEGIQIFLPTLIASFIAAQLGGASE